MSIAPATLPAHVVFRELPFCGVLLDTHTMRVYRLTQPATAVLRQALSAVPPDSAPARRLLARLAEQHLLRLHPEHDHDR